MAPGNRPTGRVKRVGTSGGGNAQRRGGGLGGGPVGGGYGRPSGGSSGGSGNRSTGGSLLAVLAAILIGKAASGGSGGGSKKGCLGRILTLVIIVIVVMFLVRTCSGSGILPDYGYDASGTGNALPVVTEDTTGSAPEEESGTASLPGLEALLNGAGSTASFNNTYTASGSDSAFKAHEPDYTVASAAREKRTVVKGNGQDTFTIMVYMCGADLESKSGMATADLQEMLSAQIGSNVNILVQTGGASYWQNQVVSNKTCQIYQIKQGGLKKINSNVGRKSMVDPDTLSTFIRYCGENFPADRYALIMWDHGGGSISGYGYDELYANDGTMTLDEIDRALSDGGVQFDFIGFDACLMATLETALVLDQYGDYMIASEATEPGTGWYYTNWISDVSNDTSMSTVDIGKAIVDDFVKYSAQAAPSSSATLSLVDLSELHGTVPDTFKGFSENISQLVSGDGYRQVADARSGARDFSSSSRINQIDLIHFAENLGTGESQAFAQALRGCVKYNRACSSMTHANGISIYFPYNSLSKVSTAVNTYEKIGLDESYTKCIKSFASMAAGGSVVSGGSGNPLGSLMGDTTGSLLGSLLGASGGDISAASSGSGDAVASLLEMLLSSESGRSVVTGDEDSSWIDGELLTAQTDYLAKNAGGFHNLSLTKKNGRTVLAMTEEQWAKVKTLEQNVFLDDGEGYIDLGLDTVMEYNEDGDLIMDYDGTWLALNGQIVSYYFISEDRVDDAYTILGRIPAMLTHTVRDHDAALLGVDGREVDYMQAKSQTSKRITERVNLIVAFTDENPDGTVLGAQQDYQNTTGAVAKGLMALEPGDKLDFLCDFYSYSGQYQDSYRLGEEMEVTGRWELINLPVGGQGYQMMYRITDEYGAKYWTPGVMK